MACLIRNVRVIDCTAAIDVVSDVLIDQGTIEIAPGTIPKQATSISGEGKLLVPGLVDLHVHFREPGFLHKETIGSGIQAAWAGGVTSALVMPNTSPSIDRYKDVCLQKKRAEKTGFDLMVAGAASLGQRGFQATDIANLKRAGVKAITDDGRPILDDGLMEKLLRLCRRHDLVFMQHAEDLRMSLGAPMHEGKISKKIDMPGQCAEAEVSMVARDLKLAAAINARYHVLHLSCKKSLELLVKAKRQRAMVSCEVAPHHVLLSESAVLNKNTCKKMNPPLRSKDDVIALINGLVDGSVDAVASDHAPHGFREKKLPFEKAPFGVVGVETSILALLTLVKREGLPLHRAISLMTTGPAKIIGESHRIGTFIGKQACANAVLLDPDHRALFSIRDIRSRSKNSAFLGLELFGQVMATFQHGSMVYRAKNWDSR